MRGIYLGQVFLAVVLCALTGCYDPEGPIPEAKKPSTAPLWTDAEVDALVVSTYESAPAIYQVSHPDLPPQCHDVKYLRFKTRSSSDDSAEADAALLLMPGVLEGANGFEYIGRQLVYMAKTQRNKNIEVWSMDRRSNCLEDLTGFEAAEQAHTVTEAEDLLLGYYYFGEEIEGKKFAGFLKGKGTEPLKDFGMEQSTLDMYAILQHRIPDPEVSRKKVFVGGHSLGGAHTSLFLAWDMDGDPATSDDQGANLVAGAVGLDTAIGAIGDFVTSSQPADAFVNLDEAKQQIAAELEAENNTDPSAGYQRLIGWLERGLLPRSVDVPAIFSAEAIALPEAVGILAAKAPDQESTVLKRMPQSLVVKNLFRLFHTRDSNNFLFGPFIEDFRYTNEAQVGLMFDAHFSTLAILHTSLGHMHGGPVVGRWPILSSVRNLPYLGNLVKGVAGSKQQHIAADAGPDRQHLGQGPVYTWADMTEIACADDPIYTDVTGRYEYTNNTEEMVRIEDFVRALYIGPTNLTEWYFPLRIMLDLEMAAQSWAPEFGINTFNQEAYKTVPTLQIIAKGSGLNFFIPEETGRILTQIELTGHSHLDPMFATVNTPSLHENRIADNVLDFMISHSQ